MKHILKWLGIFVGVLVIVVVVLHFVGKSRLNNAPEVTVHPVTVPSDAATIARGEHLVNNVSGCRLCHGENLEGELFIDNEMGVTISASNLTSGKGGIGSTYTDADWEQAIRHGISEDGRPLIIMPSQQFAFLSDADMAAMIAYLKTIPPVDSSLPANKVGFPGSIVFGLLAYDDIVHINQIDHAVVGSKAAPAEGATAEFGEYLVQVGGCRECHAENLAGITGTDGPPPGPNLTPGGELSSWSEADFISTLRTGQTPSGEQLDAEEMPWPYIGQMTDTELQAIGAYLQSLPALPNNS